MMFGGFLVGAKLNVGHRKKWATFHLKKFNLISKMGRIVVFRGNVDTK